MWEYEMNSNIPTGLEYLEDHDDGDARYNFAEVYEMQLKCPAMFFPVFKMQQLIIQNTLGHTYWEWKKRDIIDGKEDRRLEEIERIKREQYSKQKEKERVNDYVVQKRMGIFWYIMPWYRDKVRERIAKIAAISTQMDALEELDSKIKPVVKIKERKRSIV